MNRIKFFAVTGLAAATLAMGGLAAPESASAARVYSCGEAMALHDHYRLQSEIMAAVGAHWYSAYFLGKGRGIYEAGCIHGGNITD